VLIALTIIANQESFRKGILSPGNAENLPD